MRLTDIRDQGVLDEAERIMTICNACRYCEGHCAVFPAMERRLDFTAADLDYLANLCHNCGACYHHCQYAEPHDFAVNVPRTFAKLRKETYAAYAWPAFMGAFFRSNGTWVAALATLALILFIAGTALIGGPADFFAVHPDGFYGVIPHQVMAGLFGLVGLFVLLALVMGVVRYWRALGLPAPLGVGGAQVLQAVRDALTLKYLDGGAGEGCTYPGERPSLARRRFHHLTFYGFLLCFAATCVGTLYHYGFGWIAPYGYTSLPKILGISGGIGLLIGPAGLLWLKHKADPAAVDKDSGGMDRAFLWLLLLTSATGLALMLAKGTALLGTLLSIHLGIVLGLFLTLPYGKFAHGFYRLVALVAHALETRHGARMTPAAAPGPETAESVRQDAA